MKSTLEFRKGLRRLGGAVATIVLAHACALTSQAQPVSPEGTWDMVSSGGGQKGIAYITFTTSTDENGRFLFSVSQLQTTTIKKPSSEATAIRSSGDVSRSGSTSSTTTTTQTNTALFGFYHTDNGVWGYDNLGRVVGSFTEPVIDQAGITTNAISFVGKVVPGKRLTLVASTSFGKVSYRGTPFVSMPDLSGSWSGFKTQNGQSFLEFLTLTPSGIPNIYTVDGQGPGYIYSSPVSVCMVSSHKQIGFSVVEIGGSNTNGLLRATLGSFVNSKSMIGAKTKGIIEPGTNVRFNATLQ